MQCFKLTLYRDDSESRDFGVHAACNVMFLLLGERSAAYEVGRLQRSITLDSVRCCPHTAGRPEVSCLSQLGHSGPVFRMQGNLVIRKMIIPHHGNLQSRSFLEGVEIREAFLN